jgi:hypothetical protein
MQGESVSTGFELLPPNPPAVEPLSDAEVLARRREHWEYHRDMARIALKEADAQLSLLDELQGLKEPLVEW